MDIANLIIALAALGVSGWGFFFRSPQRITVDVNKDTNIVLGASSSIETARVVVTNHGTSSVSIRSIGLLAVDGSATLDYESRKAAKTLLPEGPNLPVLLEGGKTEVWHFSDELLRSVFSADREVVAYATVPRALRNPEPKEIRSSRVTRIT